MTGEILKYNRLIIFVVSALAYYVAGLIGLELAIPPGFASAVWPASGVALALIILLSSKYVIAGTFTASFALNLQLVFDAHGSLTWLNIVMPLFIALGAALQLAAGYVLFRFFLGKKIISDVARNIILFSLVVVPFSCLVSASIGTAALSTNNVISQLGYFYSPLCLLSCSQRKAILSSQEGCKLSFLPQLFSLVFVYCFFGLLIIVIKIWKGNLMLKLKGIHKISKSD
jgi:hypothetical protein